MIDKVEGGGLSAETNLAKIKEARRVNRPPLKSLYCRLCTVKCNWLYAVMRKSPMQRGERDLGNTGSAQRLACCA